MHFPYAWNRLTQVEGWDTVDARVQFFGGASGARRQMSTAPSRPLVVVVEDNPSMLAAFGRLLRAAGFDTALHQSAEAFLEHPPTTSAVCLVVDVQLPGMSGLDLQARLLAHKSRIAVIFVTGHDDPGSRSRAASLGCVGYFCKPFEGQLLVELIKRQMGRGLRHGSHASEPPT